MTDTEREKRLCKIENDIAQIDPEDCTNTTWLISELRSLTTPLPEDGQRVLSEAKEAIETLAWYGADVDRFTAALTLLSTAIRRNQELRRERDNTIKIMNTLSENQNQYSIEVAKLERENSELVNATIDRCEQTLAEYFVTVRQRFPIAMMEAIRVLKRSASHE